MITINQVKKSYNGKSGCMCGCNGNYTLPSHVSIQEANKAIGYEGYDEDSVSDRRVKIAISKVNKALEEYSDRLVEGEYDGDGVHVGITEGFAYFESNGRNTVVYFAL